VIESDFETITSLNTSDFRENTNNVFGDF